MLKGKGPDVTHVLYIIVGISGWKISDALTSGLGPAISGMNMLRCIRLVFVDFSTVSHLTVVIGEEKNAEAVRLWLRTFVNSIHYTPEKIHVSYEQCIASRFGYLVF